MSKIIGKRLKELRENLGLKNQTQFAEKLNITQTSLSKYESGAIDIPDEVKIKISTLGINLHWLLTGSGEMFLSDSTIVTRNKHFLDSPGAQIDQRLEKIEVQIAELEARLKGTRAAPSNPGMYVVDPAPEYSSDKPYRFLFVENIAAGPPINQSDDLSNYIDVPRGRIKEKIGNPEDYYAARIKGNSMIAADIPDGALALIRKSDVPKDTEIQVVRRNGESTLKQVREHEDHSWSLHYMDGTNHKIPLEPGEDYQIQGDFVAVLPED